MRKESSAARSPSAPWILSSDSSQEDPNKLGTIQSMTTSVLMMKMETFLTVLPAWENSPRIISRAKRFQHSQRLEKIHQILIWSWKSPDVKKAETTRGEFPWPTPKITLPFSTPDRSKTEFTRSEVSQTCHGLRNNATWLATISLTSLKLLTGWSPINQPVGKELLLKKAQSPLKMKRFQPRSSTEKEESLQKK